MSHEEKSKIAEQEEKTLAFWREKKIFEKSLESTSATSFAKATEVKKASADKAFIFYDGPPFATGLPHYGHLLAGTIKDVLPRYQTMKGRYVRRVWGWDCHGLPIENIIEEELGLKRKKDIEKLGIEKFNEAAHAAVLRYDKNWKEIVPRLGRWIDMDLSYVTMDWKYSESVWWAFKKLHDAGLIYEGYKSMHICPRCETTLAISEVGMNYQDVKDLAVTVKFELVDEPGTLLLAWTTTPWTLPGNVALAIGEEIEYSRIRYQVSGMEEECIVAKERIEEVFRNTKYEIRNTFLGKELVGKKYKTLFNYYSRDEKLKNRENGWKVYAADFVTTDTGTGIVHIAPAFGENDMELRKKENLPFVQHVGMDGKFKEVVADFEKDLIPRAKGKKDEVREVDLAIKKFLEEKGLLFAWEKYPHSYPHCWRCDTALLNYTASSWFVKVTALKEKLISGNKKINWVPENIRDGRFGKWLEGARDWAISRSRYWGAPIPVWWCEKCKKSEVIGSLEDLKKYFATVSGRNRYFVMRHGESENNVQNILGTLLSDKHHVTEKGREQTKAVTGKLKKEGIDVVVSSPILRAKETAEIAGEALGIPKESIVLDERFREISGGEFEGKHADEYHRHFKLVKERFEKKVGGEDYRDIKRRVGDALASLESEYEGKNILIVTHDAPMGLLLAAAEGLNDAEAAELWGRNDSIFDNAAIQPFEYPHIPRNSHHELDLHRPYIDAMTWACEESGCDGEMRRVPEVFDCWFESGSMPFAQFHYLGDDKTPEGKLFRENFPADFIAEGLDQTRGWFYTMLVLSVGLFEKSPYRNVIVNGLVLAEDGQKMSKKLKNYPDPVEMITKYGADALRYYLLTSPVVRAEDLRFSEKGVDEVYKKVVLRLQNVLAFYDLYKTDGKKGNMGENILDGWLLERLGILFDEVDKGLSAYELDRASKPIAEFIDDLSTWWLRRSRERLKGKNDGFGEETQRARQTLKYVLQELSKIVAPFMPFFAEQVYGRVDGKDKKESVHLERWQRPVYAYNGTSFSEWMKTVREICSLGLEARANKGIKVRQPLRKLTAWSTLQFIPVDRKKQLEDIIRDEVNIKEVIFSDKIEIGKVELDTHITPELREEGQLRELIRSIQDFRKESGMMPDEKDKIFVIEADERGEAFVRKFEKEITHAALFRKINFGNTKGKESREVDLENFSLTIALS